MNNRDIPENIWCGNFYMKELFADIRTQIKGFSDSCNNPKKSHWIKKIPDELQYVRQFSAHILMSLCKMDSVISGKNILEIFRTTLYKSFTLFLESPSGGSFKSVKDCQELFLQVDVSISKISQLISCPTSLQSIQRAINIDLRKTALLVVLIMSRTKPFPGVSKRNFFAKCNEFIKERFGRAKKRKDIKLFHSSLGFNIDWRLH